MQWSGRSTTIFLGDIVSFLAALWLALLVRYGAVPQAAAFGAHLIPFSFLFLVWVLVFASADLYVRSQSGLSTEILARVFRAQVTNSLIAAAFFYLMPGFGIAPKTILFLQVVITFGLVVIWRVLVVPKITAGEPEQALLLAGGADADRLQNELRREPFHAMNIVATEFTPGLAVSLVIVDQNDSRFRQNVTAFYDLLLSGARFVSFSELYETVFGRVPLSVVTEAWFLDNVSMHRRRAYDLLKRFMDIIVAGGLGVVSLIVYPLVWLAIKLDDGGPLFIVQERIGQGNRPIRIRKFRSMVRNEANLTRRDGNQVTRVGAVLRKTRIDELPQLWSVLRGDQSLIGPRPELPSGVTLYAREIPYYNVRHSVKPGLSGWAQLYHDDHPHHDLAVDQSRMKLAYDLYYVKHRSFWLDLRIALKTFDKLISFGGK